jgi:hypothetical protein
MTAATKIFCLIVALFFYGCAAMMETTQTPASRGSAIRPQSSKPKLELEYDEFKDQTEISLRKVIVRDTNGKKAYLNFYVSNKGNGLLRPDELMMAFVQSNDDWEYLTCNRTNFLIDTLRVDLGKSDHRGSVHSGSVLEQLFYFQPFSFLEKLAKSEVVRFKICNTVFSITAGDLEYIRLFYNRIINETAQ